jgi:hypothetical protein
MFFLERFYVDSQLDFWFFWENLNRQDRACRIELADSGLNFLS